MAEAKNMRDWQQTAPLGLQPSLELMGCCQASYLQGSDE